jgi:hypothetical protein
MGLPETAHCRCHCLRVGGRLRPDLRGDSTYALWLAISTYARRTLTYPFELSVKPTRGSFASIWQKSPLPLCRSALPTDNSPGNGLVMPLCKEAPPKRTITADDVLRSQMVLPIRERLIFRLPVCEGMRPGEIGWPTGWRLPRVRSLPYSPAQLRGANRYTQRQAFAPHNPGNIGHPRSDDAMA